LRLSKKRLVSALDPSERQLIVWLKDVAEKAHFWLIQSHLRDGNRLRIEGPGRDMVIDAD